MKLLQQIRAAIIGFSRNQSGVTAPIIAIAFTALVGASGYAIDMGHVMWVQRQLQSSADAAALAGALNVATNSATGIADATSYSGKSGQANAVGGATSVSVIATPKCFPSVTAPTCVKGVSNNGIVVTETATVPTYFLKIFGLASFTPTATATASAKGGAGLPMNIMVVLDTTQSMTQNDTCTIPDPTDPTNAAKNKKNQNTQKVKCAQAGAMALLQGLNPSLDSVGFMTFPPVDSTGASDDTSCPSSGGTLGSSNIKTYAAASASNYSLVGLTNSFSSGGSLSRTDPSVILAGGGKSGCKGLQAKGGVGTYYADAIKYAQAALPTTGGGQNVIVLLSDGDAGADPSDVGNGKSNKNSNNSNPAAANQCQQGISNAKDATAANTWVYTVGYGTSSSGCGSDTSNYGGKNNVNQKGLTPCQALAAMASDAGKFYSDSSGGHNCPNAAGTSDDLSTLFGDLVGSLTKPRLIPNNTPFV